MQPSLKQLVYLPVLCLTGFYCGLSAQKTSTQTIALVNGQWFNGHSFEPRTMYSVQGVFRSKKPKRVDSTIDLAGTFIIAPFGEAHNHNIGTGVAAWDMQAVKNTWQRAFFM